MPKGDPVRCCIGRGGMILVIGGRGLGVDTMMKLQRASERRHVRSKTQETWMTFDHRNAADPFHGGFRALGLLNEVKMFPGTELQLQSDGNQESVTYVREGRLIVRHRPRRDEFMGPG